MEERFEEFLTERRHLRNVSPKTIVYYRCAFKSWAKHGGEPKQWVINLRQAGLSAISVNTYICAMNAYWRWLGNGLHLDYLKEEEKVLSTFPLDAVNRLISHHHETHQRKQVRIPAMSIERSDGMSITIPGDADNALGAKRRR